MTQRPFKVLGIQQIAIGGPSKDRLKTLLSQQTDYRQRIAQLEEDWLQAQDELEALQSELNGD